MAASRGDVPSPGWSGREIRGRVTCHLPHLVADAIDDGLTQVGLHCPNVPWFEHVEALKGVKRGFLHQVGGIEETACGRREPAMCPLEARQAALKQRFHGEAIAGASPHHELECGFVAEERVILLPIASCGAGFWVMSATTGWFSIITASTGTWIRASPYEVLTLPETESNRLLRPDILLAFMIGTTVSHYQVTGKLGVGGMGVVYDAVDGRLGRNVALSFLPHRYLADDPDASRRLQREAQTLARLNHPNICTVYGIEEHASGAFMVMERCDGVNLKVHMARNTLNNQAIVDIASPDRSRTGGRPYSRHRAPRHQTRQHRRESNRSGKSFWTSVWQGVSCCRTPEIVIGGSTIPGRPLGTANYMAPERILQLPLDPRSDLFSLGVVIYEMATGRLPFGGASPSETVTNILENEATSLTALSPDRPPQLARIVNRLLAKSADSRYQSAASLNEDLGTLTAAKGFWRRLTGRQRSIRG